MNDRAEIPLADMKIESFLAGEFGDRPCVALTLPGLARQNMSAATALKLVARLIRAAGGAENGIEAEAGPEEIDEFWIRSIVALGAEALDQAAAAVIRDTDGSEPERT